MAQPAVPVLVGCGQITQREPPGHALAPLDLTAVAARVAAEDSGAGRALLAALDTIVAVRSFADTSWRFACPFGASTNPPKSLAIRLGAADARRLVYTAQGGTMPQACVTRLAGMIARREVGAALIAGGEALATQKAAERAGLALDWREDPGGTPDSWGDTRRGWSDVEDRHGMRGAIYAYPLFETAIRGRRGHTHQAHAQAMGRLLESFARVAAANPLADRRQGALAAEIAAAGPANPYIGFPYTRLMNANAFIDQAAALIMTSTETARALGIPPERWVYLHGAAEATDHWFISDRVDFASSPAMRAVSVATLAMAGRSMAGIDLLDIYSCFPSAIEIACREMGLAEDDARGLTVTGGLAYFGGPGNNYVTHAIAEAMQRLRAKPDSFALVTANGNYVTKHAAGIYSCAPPDACFAVPSSAGMQASIDARKGPAVRETAEGRARIETYAVMHGRDGPDTAILFGRRADGSRFIANTPRERALLTDMTERDYLDAAGIVRNSDGLNVFVPD